ncbi:MAG: undecaprenyl-diphosphate phosphatase [Thermodesulfobacteriota bacterium]|jgi:undecaprenyl-diphosphatase
MSFIKILILAIVQGAAELLPISSSAHVILAEKLMGLDPTNPEMTLILVMLHTGTMFAVIFYFWNSWKMDFFSSRKEFWSFFKLILVATAFTGAIGLALKFLIERLIFSHVPHAEVELLFGNLALIAVSLAIVGLLIIYAGMYGDRPTKMAVLGFKETSWIGAIQGLCLPFRGFSRSGATISVGLLNGISKVKAEEFSFALAVVITPPIIIREALRLLKAHPVFLSDRVSLVGLFYPSLMGMVFSCISGLLALRWLSRWLENGRWQLFGFYCLGASGFVFLLYRLGF